MDADALRREAERLVKEQGELDSRSTVKPPTLMLETAATALTRLRDAAEIDDRVRAVAKEIRNAKRQDVFVGLDTAPATPIRDSLTRQERAAYLSGLACVVEASSQPRPAVKQLVRAVLDRYGDASILAYRDVGHGIARHVSRDVRGVIAAAAKDDGDYRLLLAHFADGWSHQVIYDRCCDDADSDRPRDYVRKRIDRAVERVGLTKVMLRENCIPARQRHG